jgi:4-amino-4-deoxy-L-arabinose transferase-like glycosyltransferase
MESSREATVAPVIALRPAWRSSPWSGLGGVMALGLGLRLWRLDQNGYGTEYYSAGVRSMMDSRHNFLFNSFDPAGFVSLDKPPVALWIQVASAKLLGFSSLSVLLPQVLEGLASVALVYHLVARRFGAAAGLLAALFLAVTPISVVIDRSSNTDSCLVLVLLLAAWALIVAAERGSGRLFALSMALVGTSIHYPIPAHRQPAYRHLEYAEGDFPCAEWACRQVLSLPLYPELTEEELRHVASAVTAFRG